MIQPFGPHLIGWITDKASPKFRDELACGAGEDRGLLLHRPLVVDQ
jgi:hypothetical protein